MARIVRGAALEPLGIMNGHYHVSSLAVTAAAATATSIGNLADFMTLYAGTVTAVFTAVSAAIAAVSAIVAIFRVRQLHVIINSRLTELLVATSKAAHASGKLEEQQEERDRRRQEPPS